MPLRRHTVIALWKCEACLATYLDGDQRVVIGESAIGPQAVRARQLSAEQKLVWRDLDRVCNQNFCYGPAMDKIPRQATIEAQPRTFEGS